MGTRSTVQVIDTGFGREEQLVTVYRQYDGYPSEAGKDIAQALAGRGVGISVGPEEAVQPFNGAGDLAMRLITTLKGGASGADVAGNFYVVPNSQAGDEEYHYEVKAGPEQGIEITVTGHGTHLFTGTPEELLKAIEADGTLGEVG